MDRFPIITIVILTLFLTACGGGGGGEKNKSPIALFEASTTTGDAPLTVTFDASASSDPDGSISRYAWDFGDGNSDSGKTVTHIFSAAGSYTVNLTVTDNEGASANNNKTITVTSPGGNHSPLAKLTTDRVSGVAPLEVSFDASSSTDTDGNIVSYAWDFGDGSSDSGVTIKHTFSTPGTYTVSLTVTDNANASDSTSKNIIVRGVNDPPPDPASIAPVVNRSVATSLFASTEFLYTGADPIQTGVAEDTITPVRVAVLQGKISQRDGSPLSSVKVTVLNHSEFGQTLSRDDGKYDLTVNGGNNLVVSYKKDGYLPVQRKIDVPWRDYVQLPDVMMIPVDSQVTTIDLTSAEPMQVAKGSLVTDDDGKRQAVLMIPQGTTAEINLATGGTQSVSTLNIRATEYTVGNNGPKSMPAELPPTSGYTYAVELSTDEALVNGRKVNGKDVIFNQAVPFYVDNFLNFPAGTVVPVGYYDSDKAAWIPYDNGLVITIVGETAGLADVDVDGDGVADTGTALTDLGFTDAEREQLATLYDTGKSLWRARLKHLSSWDCNWPFGPPSDAIPPPEREPSDDDRPDNPCEDTSSIIECQTQTLGERIHLVGTGDTLNYRSDRVPGRREFYSIDVPLSGETVPASLKEILLKISVAGQHFSRSFSPNPNQNYTYIWDGNDGYGRKVQGEQKASINVGYVYDAQYYAAGNSNRAFAYSSTSGVAITGSRAREEIAIWRRWQKDVGILDTSLYALGGWTLDMHHAYDPIRHVVYLGDGSRHSAWNIHSVIETFAGNGVAGFGGDGEQATAAKMSYPAALAVGPDGSLYIADNFNHRIRRVTPDGIINTIAGTGVTCATAQGSGCGDGILATEASMSSPGDVAVGADGSVYFSDYNTHRIRRVGTDGIVTTVIGDGKTCNFSVDNKCGDDGPAIDAQVSFPRYFAIGNDGSFYFPDNVNRRIRRVGPDGIIKTIAGNGSNCSYSGPGACGDGGPAIDAQLSNPSGIAVGTDGSIYFADINNKIVRRIAPDGIITTVAGNGRSCNPTTDPCGDGGPAVEAKLLYPAGITVAPDNRLYIAEVQNNRIRMVSPDGIISTVAGNGTTGFSGDKGPSVFAQIDYPNDVAIGPDGFIYIADSENDRVRRVAPPLSTFTTSDTVIPSADGSELFQFDVNGRHLKTLNSLTGATLYAFTYDTEGRLLKVTDGYDNVISIQRDSAGNPLSITAPGGQITNLTLTPDKYLQSIINPAGEATSLTYINDGLLSSLADPNNNRTSYSYDGKGRLQRVDDPAGGFKTYERTKDSSGYTVTRTTALGRIASYKTEFRSSGEIRSYITYPDSSWKDILLGTDGSSTTLYSNGTEVATRHGPDPRFGMLAPFLESLTSTTPAGLVNSITQNVTISLSNPEDKSSLQSIKNTTTINGRVYTYDYDASARTYTTTLPEGQKSVLKLNAQGQVDSINPGVGIDAITIDYDEFGRTIKEAQGSQFWEYAYDDLYRLISRTDAFGNITGYSYDDADRVTQLDLPSGNSIGYTYDGGGNRTEVIMPSLDVHTLGYTKRNYFASYAAPGNPGFVLDYDLDKAVLSRTLAGGSSVSNTFDETTGRWTKINYPEAVIDADYYPQTHQLKTLVRTPTSGTQQTIALGYDGHLMTRQTLSGAAVGEFKYDYDNNFLLDSINLKSGTDSVSTSLVYDDNAGLTGYGPFTLTRDGPAGNLSQISDGTLSLNIDYDTLLRIQNRSVTVNGNNIYDYTLSHDDSGRISRKVETVAGVSHTYDYTYDADGQLKTVKRDSTTTVESYTYDENGNRLSANGDAASYDAQDRLTKQGTVNYTFDVNGFLEQRGNDSFVYSARGELLSVSLDNGAKKISYEYDGIGRRVARTDSSGTTQYLYTNPAGVQVSDIRDSSGVLTSFYYTENGNLFAMNRGGTLYYIATDQLGTPRVITDSTGTVVKQIEYDSFGKRVSDSHPGFALPIGFAGGIEDTATGLVHFGFRDYEQTAGRWTARDPVLYAGGQINLYVYVNNNPVSLKDSSGLWCIGAQGFAIVGGSGQLCCANGVCSACAEGGVGVGSEISIDPLGEAARATENIVLPHGTEMLNLDYTAKIGANCFGLIGVSAKCTYNIRCEGDCEIGGEFGPFEFSPSGLEAHPNWKPKLECGLGGKLTARYCDRFSY